VILSHPAFFHIRRRRVCIIRLVDLVFALLEIFGPSIIKGDGALCYARSLTRCQEDALRVIVVVTAIILMMVVVRRRRKRRRMMMKRRNKLEKSCR
jgi:hypothetical protein